MEDRHYGALFFVGAFLIILFLFYKSVSVFLVPLFLAAVFSLVIHPIFKHINSKLKNSGISAFIVVLLFLIVLVIPAIFTIGVIANESVKSVDKISSFINDGNLCSNNQKICDSAKSLAQKVDFVSIASKTSQFLLEKGTLIVKKVANTIFNIVIMLFCMFFFLKDGEKIAKYTESLIPIDSKNRQKISMKFKDACYAIIYGNLITALIQGIVTGIGFAIFGISNPFLWGSVAAILALLPIGGTGLVWLPAGIIMIAMGNWFSGIGIIIWGMLIVGLIDNILKPKIIGKKTELPTLLVFLTVVGGLYAFGFVGIILGPIVAALLVTLLDIYRLKFLGDRG